MRLLELADASNDVARTSGRLEKIGRLADLLRRAQPGEIRLVVAFLSGTLLQGRFGIGWAAISHARAVEPAASPSLEITDVHDVFERIAGRMALV